MAAGKEIRGKIKSVENTKKITKAMEMVAASKMRKAQDRMHAARPYAEKVRDIAANLGMANPEYVHPFMKTNDVKTAGLIVVTTDKGLCGGLNTNVLRQVTNQIRDLQSAGVSTRAVAIGNKCFGSYFCFLSNKFSNRLFELCELVWCNSVFKCVKYGHF